MLGAGCVSDGPGSVQGRLAKNRLSGPGNRLLKESGDQFESRAAAQPINHVRPELHELDALGQSIVPIVDRPGGCIEPVLLHFDEFLLEPAPPLDALAVEQGGGGGAEAMAAVNALVAQGMECEIDGVLADGVRLAIAWEEILLIASDLVQLFQEGDRLAGEGDDIVIFRLAGLLALGGHFESLERDDPDGALEIEMSPFGRCQRAG